MSTPESAACDATTDGADGVDIESHREWAKRTNGRCWDLLGNESRTADEDRELVEAAYASQWHWRHGGAAVHAQRGEWMISHVHAALGHADEALRHAQRCWAITEAESLDGFDRAYACEAFYRAYTAGGDTMTAKTWFERARAAGDAITDDEDRAIFDGDLGAPPQS